MKVERSLFFSIAAWVTIGFILLHAVFFIYWEHERMLARAQTFAEGVVDRTMTLKNASDGDLAKLNRSSGTAFKVQRLTQPSLLPRMNWPHNGEIEEIVRDRLVVWGLTSTDAPRFGYTLGSHRAQAAFHLLVPTDTDWLYAVAKTEITRFGQDVASAVFTLLSVLTAIFVVLYATKRTTRYIAALADGAERFGIGQDLTLLSEDQGPTEVRRASRAFNGMQRRIAALLGQHLQMLGAVSHDLRTIATRLSLRVEGNDDLSQQALFRRDLSEMTAILDEAMKYAREEAADEPFEPVDLVSLVQSVADDLTDMGANVTFGHEGTATVRAQPVALRRALTNLADNAQRYGDEARIWVSENGEIHIIDSGKGMTEAEAQRALQPFVRLEESRNRALGGTGLGLTIAASTITRHQGTLSFSHQPEGFETKIILPTAF